MSLNQQEKQQKEEQTLFSRRQILVGLLTTIGSASLSTNVLALDSILNKTLTNKLSANGASAKVFYTAKQLALVSRLADLIIPDTDTKGALSVGVPALMDALFAEWANEASQNKHRNFVNDVNAQLDALTESEFLDLPKPQQIQSLTTLDQTAFSDKGQHLYAYRDIKNLIARFYYVSEEGATQELRYQAVPGRWDSCIDFEKVGRTWAV